MFGPQMERAEIARAEGVVPKLFPRLDETGERIARTLYQLLARGQPVAPGALAETAGTDPETIATALGIWHGIHRNSSGAVTGFWGLTLDTTPHRLHVAGRTLHAWCAWDTLFLPALLDSTADVESICPASGATLHLVVAPAGICDAPPETVMSFVTPERVQIQEDVFRHFCRFVRFFASAHDAGDWLEHHPGTFLVSLAEAWSLARMKLSAQYPSFGAAEHTVA
ncbi:MAG: organomercurial lyase [Burkholderiales bacterium]